MAKFKLKNRGCVVYYQVSFNRWEVYTICRTEERAREIVEERGRLTER